MNHKLLFAIALTAVAVPTTCQDLVAVKAKTIHTLAGETVEDGVILMQNGRITKIARQDEVEIPWAAKVIDASDKVVMPTWVVAHASIGMSSNNERMQNVPWLSVADALDPSSRDFEAALRNGVGTVHVMPGNNTLLGGGGMVVRPFGRTIEDMSVAANTGLKLSLLGTGGSRLQKIREMRRALDDLREYLADFNRRKDEFEQEQAAGAVPADKKWTEEIDRTKKPGVDLVEKKAKGWLYVPSFAELDEALRMGQQLDLQLVLGNNLDEAAGKLSKLKQPVVVTEDLEYYEKDEETQDEQQYCVAKLLADAGVPFALSLGRSGPTSYPWWQLGTCVRHGIPRQQALEALTIVPARILGLDGQVGTLEVGKLGNLQILTGDPLQATTWVDTVVLEGKVAYERSEDPRLQFLFEDARSDAANPAAPKKDGN